MRAWMRCRGVVWLAVSQIAGELACDPARMLDFVFAEQRAIERGEETKTGGRNAPLRRPPRLTLRWCPR